MVSSGAVSEVGVAAGDMATHATTEDGAAAGAAVGDTADHTEDGAGAGKYRPRR